MPSGLPQGDASPAALFLAAANAAIERRHDAAAARASAKLVGLCWSSVDASLHNGKLSQYYLVCLIEGTIHVRVFHPRVKTSHSG